MSTPQAAELPVGVSPTAAISNHVVRVIAEYTGRGPTKARTVINDRLVTVLLEDTLTKGERTLVRDGQTERVLDTRKAYQHTMRERLIAGIEEILGQKVVAFMSDNHVDPDVAIEAFVLAPAARLDSLH
jgi:uncharacterized protein YbcI